MQVGVDAVNYTISATDVSKAAVDSAIAGTKKLGQSVETLQSKMQGQLQNIQKNWLMVSAGVTAAWFAIQKAWSMMDAAANYNERISVLNALGAQYQMTGDQIVASMQKASVGTLSMRNAADLAAKSLNMALNPMQMAGFTEAAKGLKKVIGGTLPEAYDQMVSAAAKGRVTMLREWGIIVDLEKAYKAKATATGREKDELGEAEKQQIRYNLVLEEAKRKIDELGPAQKSLKTEMSKLKASVDDASLAFSQIMLRAGSLFLGIVKGAAAAGASMYALAARIADAFRSIDFGIIGDLFMIGMQRNSRTIGAIGNKLKIESDAAWKAAQQLAQEGLDSMTAAFASADDLAAATKKSADEQEKQAAESEAKRKTRMEKEKRDRTSVNEMLYAIRQRANMQSLQGDARELKTLDEKQRAEIGKLLEHNATKEQLAQAAVDMALEKLQLEQEQKKKKTDDYYQEVLAQLNNRAKEEQEFYREQSRVLTEIEIQGLQERQSVRDSMSAFGEGGVSGFDKIMEGFMNQTGMIENEYTKQRDLAKTHWENMLEYEELGLVTSSQTKDARNSYDLAKKNANNRQQYQSTVNFLKMSEGALTAYAEASGNKSKAMFFVVKAIQIAQALVAGHLMAMQCAAEAAKGGWISAAAAFAIAEALNIANAAAMAAVAIGQASSMGAQPTGGSAAAPTTPSYSEPPTSRYETTPQPIVINVVINGSVMNNYDELARNIVQPIQKAIQDGAH